ncbi:hypothetical protein IJ531_00355 [bacterium]|nr:hypothetical protein [bacterium]
MRIILSILLLFCIILPCDAFSFKKTKKQVSPAPKMVETKQEWEIEAQNVPLADRELKKSEAPKSDKRNYYPEPHYTFEKYNYPAGKREYDIRFIKKNLVEHPIMVSDINCEYVAYANYYYRADIDQIYSDFYIGALDKTKTKTKRILDYNHRQLKRVPVLASGFNIQYPHLFNGLTLVDWSHDSNKLLIKERIGSTVGGNYRIYLYVHFRKENKTIKLSNFNDAIINYYTDYENLQMNKYLYDIEPLGFSAENDDMILAHCYLYDNDGNKIFMGVWGYDLSENKTVMVSKTNPSVSISANGLVLQRVIE